MVFPLDLILVRTLCFETSLVLSTADAGYFMAKLYSQIAVFCVYTVGITSQLELVQKSGN